MNYTMGRYIRELDAEGRDRLIAAPDFSSGEWWNGSCGCLVGTADPEIAEAVMTMGAQGHSRWLGPVGVRAKELCRDAARGMYKNGPALRYPHAVSRFGKPRVVRAIKLRAARLNGSSHEQIQAILAQSCEKVGV